MFDVIAATYFGVGIWLALLMRDEFIRDKEWMAAAPIIILAWLPGVVVLAIFKAVYEIKHWRCR